MFLNLFGRTVGFTAAAILVTTIALALGINACFGGEEPATDAGAEAGIADEGERTMSKADKQLWETVAIVSAIAFTVGCGCIAAGYAVARVGAAAMGAAGEKPEIIGRALMFVALAEAIAIYGLLIGILLWMKL